jgi:subtilisin family serine protease
MKNLLYLLIFFLGIQHVFSTTFHVKLKSSEYNREFEKFCDGKFDIKKLYSFPKSQENVLNSDRQLLQERLNTYYTISNRNSKLSPQSLYLLSYIETVFPVTTLSITSYKSNSFSNSLSDPLITNQWYLERIEVPTAWEYSSGDGVLIGVIDTGIEEFHSDLQKNLWVNSQEDINKNGKIDPYLSSIEIDGVFGDFDGIDNDGNGFIDDVIGYDFVDQDLINSGDYSVRDGYPQDERGHGTSVTGIIAAEKDNGIGIAGIAYNSKIMTLRAFDITGNGQDDDVAASMIYAVLNGVKILNCSFGDVYKSPIVADAIQFALASNVVVVVSAGNERASFDRYPANISGVISVSATTEQDRSASFSSFGNFISLAAPGVNILTSKRNNGYEQFAGTSASAPIVSGVVALMLEKNPLLTPKQVKSIIENCSEDIGTSGWDIYFGAGLVNAKNAVQFASTTDIAINSPTNEQHFLRENTLSIPISISTIVPLFEKSELYWGIGNNPTMWNSIYTSTIQEKYKDISPLLPSDLTDNTIVLRLVVSLKNGRTIENRTKIFLYSKSTVELQSYDIFPSRYGALQEVYVRTDYTIPIRNVVERVTNGSSIFSTNQIALSNEFFHKVGILSTNSVDEIRMKAYLPNDSISFSTVFSANVSTMPERTIFRNTASLPPGYICPKVYPVYENGTTVLLNDFSSGNWGTLRTYTYENSQFTQRDSLEKNWVPRAMGNTNGDNLKELLVQEFGKTILFEQTEVFGNPFSRIIFSDTVEQNFWGVGLEDIDGDGIDDIIGFNDSALVVKSFKNNRYEDIYIFPNPSRGSSFSGRKYVFGNFDNDANKEIAFVDFDADLSIYEITPSGIRLEYFLERDGIEATQMIAAGDIDGDGIDEIISGFSTSERLTTFRKPTTPFWNFYLLKHTGTTYQIVDTLIVSDVRIGGPFFNSVSIEAIDTTNAKKVILSLFPYLYVFGFENNKLVPCGLSFSNSPTITALPDKTFLVNRGDSTVNYSLTSISFFEAPTIYDAYVEQQSLATIKWIGNSLFDRYNVVVLDQNSNLVKDTIVNSASMTISVLPNTVYRAVVYGITSSNDTSLASSVYSFVSTPQITAIFAETMSKNTLKVTYSGVISSSNHQPNYYSLRNKLTNQQYSISSANPYAENSVLISTYTTIEEGEYSLVISSFRDGFGNPSIANTLEFTQTKDVKEFNPFFMNFSQLNTDNSLIIGFSQHYEWNSASNITNYSLLPNGSISSITQIDSTKIKVIFSDNSPPFASGKTYYVTARNIFTSNQSSTIDSTIQIAFVLSTTTAENSFFYPNPFVLSKDKSGYFANIPQNSVVEIYTLDGQLKQQLTEKNGNGGIEWNGKGFNGEQLPIGIYVFKVRNELTEWKESDFKKILIK